MNSVNGDSRIEFKGMSLSQLEEQIIQWGEPRFRARQIYKWLYDAGALKFEEMTNLPAALRQQLSETARIGTLKMVARRQSEKDGSTKFLFELEDDYKIESVLMPDGNRRSLCISTQVGCAIDCKFCATGLMGLQRHLTAGEIVEQFLMVRRLENERPTNIVCMGMGEPFHNYDNLMAALEIITSDLGPGLSPKRIVISTSGVVPKILQFADEGHKYRLAISLNATDDETRTKIMPLNKKWPLVELVKAARYYSGKSRRRLTFEYALLGGVNDTEGDARRLMKFVRGIPCKINLIPYNPTLGDYKRPSDQRIEAFYRKFADSPVPVTIRWSKGDDIDAACGQLATSV